MFKVGDKVMIRPDSNYYGQSVKYNPANVVGHILEVDLKGHFNPSIRVEWPEGRNGYRISDLMLAHEGLRVEDFV